MADDKNDIVRSEIERYRRGLMSEAERHALEKKALSDPFLADALEGAEQILPEAFSEDLDELTQRLAGIKSGNWFTPLRIAAGVIILIGSGSLIYYLNAPEPEQLTMKETAGPEVTDSSTLPKGDSSSAFLSLAKPEEPAAKMSNPVQHSVQSAKADQRTAEAAGQPIAGAGKLQEPAEPIDTKAGVAPDKTEITLEAEEAKKEAIADSEKDLAAPAAAIQKSSRAKGAYGPTSRRIAGHILSSDDGTPLPGVNVIVKGTNQGTITDGQGNFQLSTQAKNPQLVMSFIGMETKEVSADQVPLDVRMNSDARQLSEVVVSGYSGEVRDDAADEERSFEFATPAGGRSAFQKYLEAGIRYPAEAIASKTEGKVTVQFTVTANGTLTNFTVIKGIGNGCDEELLRLIQDGPTWTPSRRNQVPTEDKVRVRLRFSLPR
jgi:TonB family protein